MSETTNFENVIRVCQEGLIFEHVTRVCQGQNIWECDNNMSTKN